MTDVCPECNSQNVEIGNSGPLRCNTCGWNYLNQYPCNICNEPATSVIGARNFISYRCSKHSHSEKEIQEIFGRWFMKRQQPNQESVNRVNNAIKIWNRALKEINDLGVLIYDYTGIILDEDQVTFQHGSVQKRGANL